MLNKKLIKKKSLFYNKKKRGQLFTKSFTHDLKHFYFRSIIAHKINLHLLKIVTITIFVNFNKKFNFNLWSRYGHKNNLIYLNNFYAHSFKIFDFRTSCGNKSKNKIFIFLR